ncbi:hypothetical protein BXY51_002147 [Actinoplanes cyaneus]|nr:hypothetical protein [Actinoplanes cyaneus]
MVAQISLFSRTELAGMRDRTLARNYSAEAEEFRRDHERHRAWGLRQRHARKLVRAGWGASAAWAAVTAGEDQQRAAASAIPAPSRPTGPAPSPPVPVAAPSAGRVPGETPPSAQHAAQHVSGQAGPVRSQLATSPPGPARQRLEPGSPGLASPQLAPGSPGPASPQLAPRSPGPASRQLAPAGSPALASQQLAPGSVRAGLFIVLAGWCVMVVKVTLDKVGCRRVRRGHRAMVQVRAVILDGFCCSWKVSGARGPPTFLYAFSTPGRVLHRYEWGRLATASSRQMWTPPARCNSSG